MEDLRHLEVDSSSFLLLLQDLLQAELAQSVFDHPGEARIEDVDQVLCHMIQVYFNGFILVVANCDATNQGTSLHEVVGHPVASTCH